MILLAILAIAATVVLLRTILTDGYGTRPGPRSHHDVQQHGRL